jgi:hypothetical protein
LLYLYLYLWRIKVKFEFLGRNSVPLEPIKIYDAGSNKKLVFVLYVFALPAVFKEWIQLMNWGIILFILYVLST